MFLPPDQGFIDFEKMRPVGGGTLRLAQPADTAQTLDGLSDGVIQDSEAGKFVEQELTLKRPNQLALSAMTNPQLVTLYNLREYIRPLLKNPSYAVTISAVRLPVRPPLP